MTDIILPELKKITELYKESYGENSNYDLSSYLGHTLQIKKNNLEDIFKILNTKGVIAGGSVVYALNDFVPKTSVGDIDIFINDPKTDHSVFVYWQIASIFLGFKYLEFLRN